MRENAKACQRREIERLSTEKLDEILQQELRKDMPDEDVVMPILEILAEREADYPVEITEDSAAAWDHYQERITAERNKNARRMPLLGKIAAIAAVAAVLVVAVPMTVDADGTLDILYRLTESVIEFFSPGGRGADPETPYVFKTDNPGLQQVHDKVVELGVTEPVVPMWLPDGYVLEELDVTSIPGGVKVVAKFDSDESSIILQYKISEEITSTLYEREDGVGTYEVDRTAHLLFENTESVGAVWVAENVECWLTTEALENSLIEIIDSIYWR